MIWGMFMAVTMESAVFMGKIFQDNQNSIVNTADLTLKQMFDISAKLVGEQDEILNVDAIDRGKHSWKYLSLIGDETVINLQRAKVYVFSDSVLCLGKIHQHPNANKSWKDRIEWTTTSQSYRDYDGISGEPTELEWNISQDSQRCSSVVKSMIYGATWEKHQKFSQEEFYLCRCSTTFLVERKTMKENAWQMLKSSLYMQRSLV